MKRASALGISIGFHALVVAVFTLYRPSSPKTEGIVLLDMSLVEPSQAERVVEDLPVIPLDSPPPRPTDCGKRIFDLSCELTKPQGTRETFEVAERPSCSSVPQPPSVPSRTLSVLRQAGIEAPPRPLCAIHPDYPRKARRRGAQGNVALEACVLENGSVSDVRVCNSSGHDDLDVAAVRAVRGARFIPAQCDHRPVAATVRLSLQFRLR